MKGILEGRVVLISGSSRGIGAATARLAKEYEARVVLHGQSDSEQLRELAEELESPYVFCDVTNEGEVERVVGKLFDTEQRVDVLVNCAGITNSKSFLETSEDEWLDVFRTNVLGTVHFCKAVIPHMQHAKYGRIVNVSSIRGYGITSGRVAYSTSKAAILSLTSSLAKEFAPNVMVNAVSPGYTRTDMSKTWNEQTWDRARASLLDRIAEPSEIAEVILFLASEKASFMTGQSVLVDGGYSISGK